MFLVLVYLVLGGLVGLGVGHVMRGYAFRWYGDLIAGVIGGLLGGLLFGSVFGTLRFAVIGQVLAAILVACLLVSIVHLVRPQGLARSSEPRP